MPYLNDAIIASFDEFELLSGDTIDALYDIDDEVERERLKSLMVIRARNLNCEKPLKNVLAVIDVEQRKVVHLQAKKRAKRPFDPDISSDGKIKSTINNFVQIMENDGAFDNVRYNTLAHQAEIDGKPWSDADNATAKMMIEKKYGIENSKKFRDAFNIFCKGVEYNPVIEKIQSIQWDGKSRVEDFLIKWMSTENTAYAKELSRLIFAGGINRIFNPGCKFDEMVVLVGTRQGEGKSTIVRWLNMDDNYYSEVTNFDEKLGVECLQGSWICEVSELLALTRQREQEAVKAYLSRQVDNYRRPYAEFSERLPRQCIFIGTTNKVQFLTDRTGNRRFYPIAVESNAAYLFKHKDEVQKYIEQCWAEAYHAYINNSDLAAPFAKANLHKVIKEKQAEALEDDYRIGMIKSYLEGRQETCVIDLWENALNMFGKPTRKESNDITLILQSLDGWHKADKVRRFGSKYGVQRAWVHEDNPW